MNRVWKILCWNVRGLNGPEKWPHVRSKIEESMASIICFQETKCGEIETAFLRNFVPKRFDQFLYAPLMGPLVGFLLLGPETFSLATFCSRRALEFLIVLPLVSP